MAKFTYEEKSIKFVPLDYKGNPQERWHLPDGNLLDHVHSQKSCESDEACVIHKPSDHALRDWPLRLRFVHGQSKPMFARICPSCDEEHLDPDEAEFFGTTNEECWCDCGCCQDAINGF